MGWLQLGWLVLGFLLPITYWFFTSISSWGENVGPVPSRWGAVLFNTVCIAGGGALLAGLLGTAQALVLGAFDVRGRGMLVACLLLPFLLPPAAVTTSVHSLWAGGTLGFLTQGIVAAIVIGGWQMSPVVLWGITRSLNCIKPAERDAIRATLSPARAAWTVLLPRVRGSVAALTLLVFLLLLPQREVAGYVGVETLGNRVLAAFSAVTDVREGWIGVGLLALISLPVIMLIFGLLRHSLRVPGGLEARSQGPEGTSWLATVLLWGIVVLWLVPFWSLFQLAATAPLETARVWGTGLLWEVLRCGLISSLVVVAGWRLLFVARGWVWLLCLLPLFQPGTLGALALLETVQPVLPQALLDAPVLMSLAQIARWLGIGLVLGFLAWESIPPAERQAASHLPPAIRRWRVFFPRSAAGLASAILIVWILLLGDVESAVLLVPPGYVAPVVELHQFLHFRYDAHAAQLAAALTLVGVIGALGLGGVLTRQGRARAESGTRTRG